MLAGLSQYEHVVISWRNMDVLYPIALAALYFAVMRWVLPRAGVPT